MFRNLSRTRRFAYLAICLGVLVAVSGCATRSKVSASNEIATAMFAIRDARANGAETYALEALNELRDIGETDPVKILQSKTSIFRAIHRQLRARIELKRAISELQKSLKQLQAPDKPKRNNGRNSRAPAGPKLKERPQR